MFGIGCNAFSQNAIDRINELKRRPSETSYIVLLPNMAALFDLQVTVSPVLRRILEQFWPGNLTVILPCNDSRLQPLARNGKVAFRIPDEPVLLQLLDTIQVPLVSTSINISGYPYLRTFKEIKQTVWDWFDLGVLPRIKLISEDTEPSTIIDMVDGQLVCLREGSIPFYRLKSSFQQPQILMVCTGNICRSPLAEYRLRKKIKEANLPYTVASGGLSQSGVAISKNSLLLLMEDGINAVEHFSRKIDEEMLAESWLVLTMEERQRDFLCKTFPQQAAKIKTINEFCGLSGDIIDPYGEDIEFYREVDKQIKERVETITNLLQEQSR